MPVILAAILFVITLFIVLPINAQDSQDIKWQEVPLQSGEVAEIVIAPSNPNIMYAGFEVNSHSLYKSEDGGKNWRRVDGGGDHTKDVAVSPKDPNRVYFAMSEQLQTTDLTFTSSAKSLYGGPPAGGLGNRAETQTILTTGISAGGGSVSFSSIEIYEEDDNIMYAARKGGFGGPGGKVTPKIWKTTDRGRSWEGVGPNLEEASALAIHPKEPNTIYIGNREGVYVSHDSGKTLESIKKARQIISVEIQKDNPNIIFAAGPNEIHKTEDGGETWTNITGKLSGIHRVRIFRSNPDILYVSTDKGVFRSDDGGLSWKDVSGDLKAKNIQIVEIHPQNPDIAFVGHSSLWSSVRSEDRYRTGLLAYQGIFKTTDGGKSWERSDEGIKEYDFEEVAINPSKPYEAWVQSPASRGGYKTEDGGHSFRLSQTPTMHYPMRIRYSMQNKDTLYATGWQNGAPFSISEDGGVNWKFINEQVFFKAVTRGKELLKSERGGGAIHLHGLAVDPSNDKIVYAGSISDSRSPVQFPLKGAHIFKSEDGGNTWKESDEGFPHDQDTAIHDITVDPKNTGIIYVSTTRHESEKGIGVYKSEDKGVSWQAKNNGLSGDSLSVNALIINPENTSSLVAATFAGLYKSTDGGNSWKRTSTASSFDVEYVIDEPNTVYASTDIGVLKSNDFGEFWKEENEGLPASTTGRLQEGVHGPGQGHIGEGIGVDKTGQVIYTAIRGEGLFVARLSDIPKNDLISEFGGNPYGSDPFAYGYSGPSALFKILDRPIFNFVIPAAILGLVGGVIIVSVLIVRRRQQSNTTVSQSSQKVDDLDV